MVTRARLERLCMLDKVLPYAYHWLSNEGLVSHAQHLGLIHYYVYIYAQHLGLIHYYVYSHAQHLGLIHYYVYSYAQHLGLIHYYV